MFCCDLRVRVRVEMESTYLTHLRYADDSVNGRIVARPTEDAAQPQYCLKAGWFRDELR